jgi:hypothetical protein
MGRFSLAIPLAAAAAVLTLMCSASLLNSSPALDVRHSIQEEQPGNNRLQLTDYMHSESATAAHTHQPTAAARSVASSTASTAAVTPPAAAAAAAAAATARGADASPPAAAAPPLATTTPSGGFTEADYDGFFLFARVESVPSNDPTYLRRLLKSLLGMAVLLKRTLVLPAALCNCRDAALTQCDGPSAGAPFDCPLREALDVASWSATKLVPIRPARFLADTKSLPDIVRCSHLRVLLPDGMDDSELGFALRSYSTTRWLEVETADKTFCGWDTRMPGNPKRMADFTLAADELLRTRAATTTETVELHRCTHYRGGTGEVLQFTNLGCNAKHVVTTAREKLPENIRNLPKDTDIMVTFATGSVATMACNWVANVRRAGVKEVVIGALDEQMMDACRANGVPCVKIEGGAVSKALASRTAANVRSDPALYPKMSVLKVGFYGELLSFGYNVWACDADAIIASDPRAMLREEPWALADVAIATDCIDVPGDTRYPLLHCDFNTGLVYLRARPDVLDFVERWRETIATAKEARIRDQAAFNMMTKLRPLQQMRDAATNKPIPRVFKATNGGDGHIKLAVLPLNRYLNGHTYFVQHVHTLPSALPALSVHMTYQFAEGSKFAYGKRQRLRQAGLWLVDDDSYYNGRYVTVSAEAATLPLVKMGLDVDSRDAVKAHLAEARHRSAVLRPLLGIAKATGRAVVLPRMLCYCDFMWKEMKNCRVGGAESMRLPFECPMDHVLDTPRWFENELGVPVREEGFFSNPRVPTNVSSSIVKVSMPKGRIFDELTLRDFLKPHDSAAVIELSDVVGSFCGFSEQRAHDLYVRESERMLTYQRTPFCTMEGSDNAPLFSQCCHPRKPGDKFFPCVYGFEPPQPLPSCPGAGSLFG